MKRYNIPHNYQFGSPSETDNGEWVKHSDAEKRVNDIQTELDYYKMENGLLHKHIKGERELLKDMAEWMQEHEDEMGMTEKTSSLLSRYKEGEAE